MLTNRPPGGVMPARHHRSIAAAAVVAVAAGAVVGVAASATSAGAHPAQSLRNSASGVQRAAIAPFGERGAVHWAKIEPACSTPKNPRAVRCYALKRVDVSASTPGARAYIRPAPTTGPAGGYTPADLAFFYGFNPNTPRSGQTIAIVDWYNDPKVRADLNTFDHHYGLPTETATSFRVVNQNGQASPLPANNSSTSVEISLDVQSARAVCHTCKIVLIEANGPFDPALATAQNTAVRLRATEISDSYGEPERAVSATIRNAYNHPGVITTVSTGDDGWFGWDFANQSGGSSDNAPSFPASSPYVVSIGGTTLGTDSNGKRAELVWNENGPEDTSDRTNATGSGCSKLYAAPAWQSHYPNYAKAHCGGKRLAADVSAIADPYFGFDIYDSFGNSGWTTIGGTSLASPVTAALFALAGGAHGAKYAAASLYVNAAVHPASLYDVWNNPAFTGATTGNGFCSLSPASKCGNDVFAATGTTHNPNSLGFGLLDCSFSRNVNSTANATYTSTECNVVKGLDGPTGLGAPKSTRLYTATNPTVTIKVPAKPTVGVSQLYSSTVTEPVAGTTVKSRTWGWGDGTAATTGASVHHKYTKAGTYHITLTVTDSRYQTTVAHATVVVK